MEADTRVGIGRQKAVMEMPQNRVGHSSREAGATQETDLVPPSLLISREKLNNTLVGVLSQYLDFVLNLMENEGKANLKRWGNYETKNNVSVDPPFPPCSSLPTVFTGGENTPGEDTHNWSVSGGRTQGASFLGLSS